MKIIVMYLLFIVSSLFILLSCHLALSCDAAPMVRAIALDYKLDPDLVIAIMEVESECNEERVGKLGERGLFQLRPEFHSHAAGPRDRHVTIAIRYLDYVRARCAPAYGDAWFICFNQGPFKKPSTAEPTKTTYYKKVMEKYASKKSKTNSKKEESDPKIRQRTGPLLPSNIRRTPAIKIE